MAFTGIPLCEMNAAPATDIDWTALARSRYTDPASARARLDQCETPSKRLFTARTMLTVARNPRFRFGLERDDVNPAVVELLEREIGELEQRDAPRRARIVALAKKHHKLEKQGHAQDTIWSWLDAEARQLGLGYGDSTYLRAVYADSKES